MKTWDHIVSYICQVDSVSLTVVCGVPWISVYCLPCKYFAHVCSSLLAHGFMSEDEYLEITGITREQSGLYECSAANDVSSPDVRRVKVTVNCK